LEGEQLMFSSKPLDKRLQISGTFLIAGLLIEAACLVSAKPIAFVIFVALGGLLLFAGVVIFLLSLVSNPGVNE
jgi:hypothetical protein